jgi:hypothetical protein
MTAQNVLSSTAPRPVVAKMGPRATKAAINPYSLEMMPPQEFGSVAIIFKCSSRLFPVPANQFGLAPRCPEIVV